MPSEKTGYLRQNPQPIVEYDEVLLFLTSKPSEQLAELLLSRSEHDVILRKLIYTDASLQTCPRNFNQWKQVVEFALDLPLEPIDHELEYAGATDILELLIHKLEIFKTALPPKDFKQWSDYLCDCADTLTEHFHDGDIWMEALENLNKLRTVTK